MLSKLALLLQSKTALAALGVLLVGSGGTAVAVTAASGHVPFTNISMSSSHTSAPSGSMPTMQQTPAAQPTANAHANSVAIEGVLKATNTAATGGATATATATATGAMTTAQTAITSIRVQMPGSKKAVTILVNAQTRVTGQAHTLAQLTKYRGHHVQVQADKTGTTLTAWKITVEGMTTGGTPTPATGAGTGTGTGTGAATATAPAAGTAGGQNGTAGQQEEFVGTVTSVSVRTASFLVRVSDATFVRVVVTSTTQFSGTVMTLSALRTGTYVMVSGTMQANGTLVATSVKSVPR